MPVGISQENLSALQLVASLKVLGPQNVGESHWARRKETYSSKLVLKDVVSGAPKVTESLL